MARAHVLCLGHMPNTSPSVPMSDMWDMEIAPLGAVSCYLDVHQCQKIGQWY
jgi:hypothetical protein